MPVLLCLLHSVIAHEIKHIYFMEGWKKGTVSGYDIGVFFEFARRFCLRRQFSLERLAEWYLKTRDHPATQKQRSHFLSKTELSCYRFGFSQALNAFSDYLPDEFCTQLKRHLESIDFLEKNLEIEYLHSKQAHNHFSYTLSALQRILIRDNKSVDIYPQLKLFFDENGLLRSPIDVFHERNIDNTGLIDSYLLRLFIALPINWATFFSADSNFFALMEKLCNEYCGKAINYIKDISLGEVFLSMDILQDNAAMLIKNVKTLNQKMKEYNMLHTTGSLYPLYYSNDFTIGNR